MSDLRLDPTTGDLDISTGDLSIVTGRDAVRQQIALRLSLQKGEWFFDLRDGVPWREQVLVRKPNMAAISAIFRERILSTPKVSRLDSFSLTFDNVSGLFTLDFVAITADGEVAATASGEDIESLILLLLLPPAGVVL